MAFEERRSRHAVVVDRSLQARRVFSEFGPEYSRAQNRSDVEGYDTKGKVVPPPEAPRRPVGKPQPVPPSGEYVPSEREREVLRRRYFWKKESPMEQHKDLLTTRRVVRSERALARWKENPKDGDVRGVDTAPEGLARARIEAGRKAAGGIPIFSTGREARRSLGFFVGSPYRENQKIVVREKKIIDARLPGMGYTVEGVTAHEVGHAFNYNVAGGGKYYRPMISKVGGGDPFGIRGPVEVLSREKVRPYDRAKSGPSVFSYRNSDAELFADWFGALMVSPGLVRRKTKGYYRKFRGEFKPFVRELRVVERGVTRPFMSRGL